MENISGRIKNNQGSKGIRQWMVDLYTSLVNDDKQNCPFSRLKVVVEQFGHYQFGTNQSKFNKSTQSFKITLLKAFWDQYKLQSSVPSLPENNRVSYKIIYHPKLLVYNIFFYFSIKLTGAPLPSRIKEEGDHRNQPKTK